MSVEIQRPSENMTSRSRLPLQTRNPNLFGSLTSSSSGEHKLSTLESSNNEMNKAKTMNSSASLQRSSSNSNTGNHPAEMGNENDASLVTHTGTAGSAKPAIKRTMSGSSAGSARSSHSQAMSAPDLKQRVPPTSSESDQDIVVEEKRKRINGEGYTVHRYLRGRLLGKGGFAKVYLCTALDTNKQYAVKVVPKANLVKTRARQKLQAEIKIHRTLKHKNVCEYKHFFEDRTNCYILLELCHNQSMNELMKRRKRLTEPESAFFMSQLIEAVQYMHEECVIHRDLKLGNLFLDRNNNVKVGDLGLASRLANAEEKRKTICGTPNYIAPEVIQGTKETRGHSFEVDVWSMGVILFTVLVGKPPYEAKDVKATYQRIIANEYSFPDRIQISDAAKDLITSMLQTNPENRPTLSDMSDHPFFKTQIPTSLPNSILHTAPEWFLNEYGDLVIGSTQGGGAPSEHRISALPQTSRQPFSSRDPNAVPKAVEQAKAEKRERAVREAAQERKRAILSTAPAPPSNFQIYDETAEKKSMSRTPTSSSTMDEIISRAATLSLSSRKQDPEGSVPEAHPLEDTEILNQMLDTLSTALEVAEARKFSYSQASVVNPTSRGGPATWVSRYVDYTSKYGLGFLLNDGSSGVYFNDSTKAVLEKEGDTFEYVERRKVETTAGIVKKNEPVCETLSLVNYPESLSKKVTLLKHFRNYLIEQEKKSDDDGSVLDSVNNVASTAPMTYVKKWVRTKHAILFRLSNQTVQIVFYDQTEVLLTPDQRFVTYVDKRRNRSTYYLNDELVGTNPEMAKRLKYAKEILSQLMHGQPTR